MSARGAPSPFDVEIPQSRAGERFDRALAALHPDVSRSTFQRWIEEGRVTLSGIPISAKDRARAGQTLHVEPAPPPPSDATPQPIPLAILYEDEDLVVVDKPAGLVVHPAPGHPDGTLVNALLHRFGVLAAASARGGAPAASDRDDDEPEIAPADRQRPGIVHRLDRDTSGVMVVARTVPAREGLMRSFRVHDIDRAYLAIVLGAAPDAATYDTLHGRHPHDRKRFTTKVVRGKRAVTHVERVEALHRASLVRCRLETGRTHQIRVHLSEHGHPLLGDPLYGRRPDDPRLREVAEQLGRQALHAAVLGFVHPVRGVPLRFETAAPEDFRRALDALRQR